MVNVNRLKGKIVEQGLNVDTLAKKIGIDTSTLYRKLAGNGETFLISEVNVIVSELELSCEDALAIFFSQFVA